MASTPSSTPPSVNAQLMRSDSAPQIPTASLENMVTNASTRHDDIVRAVADPLGYGYDGRVTVDPEYTASRIENDERVRAHISRGEPLLPSCQLLYLMTHGHYTLSELSKHPAFRDLAKEKEKEKDLVAGKSDNVFANVIELEIMSDRWKELESVLKAGGEEPGTPSTHAKVLWLKDNMKTASTEKKLVVVKQLVKELEAEMERRINARPTLGKRLVG